MRLTSVFALLLWAASILTGSHAGAAEAHGKAVSRARAGTHPKTSEINSRTNSKSKTKAAARAGSHELTQSTGRRANLRAAQRASVRRAKFTPANKPAAAAEIDPDYANGFKNGYQAGLAAARKQLEREQATATPTARVDLPDNGYVTLPATRRPVGPRSTSADATTRASGAQKAVPTPAVADTTETEAPETPPIDQMATLHVGSAGMPAPLRGSLASLERQNDRTEADGLERILDEADLASRIEHKLLVPVPASSALMVNPNLSENHRYCRPWTARFVADLARAHQAAFHKPITVNSAVRTVEYQKRLMGTNGNAAAAEGDVVSPHLTGATIDIGKQGLSRKEMDWMRRQLMGLQEAGKIDVEEEFQQACFHITVYKSYASSLPQHKSAQPAPSRANAPGRDGGTPTKTKPASQLPADLAVGGLGSQGR